MINITRRIKDLQDILDDSMGIMDPAAQRKYSKEIDTMKETLEWVGYQCSHLYEGSYNSETKEMKFVMKNTTHLHFKELRFSLITSDNEVIPISVTDWKPRKTKEISFYHNFNNDLSYKTRKVIKFKNHADSVEYELYDKNANRNTGLKDGETRKLVTRFSKKQSYLVTIRSFCDNVTELDLRAKARRLQSLVIDIYDIMRENPGLQTQTRKFMSVYLPTICRVLDDYQEAAAKNNQGNDMAEIRDKTHETLNLSISAFVQLKKNLMSNSELENQIDLDIMKKFMKEEGLIK